MRIGRRASGLLLLIWTAAGGPLGAQGGAVEAPVNVDIDRFVLLAGGDHVGEERTVVPGDTVLATRIGYATAASLRSPVAVEVAGVRIRLGVDSRLYEASVGSTARRSLGESARIFCGPALSEAERGDRFRRAAQPCLIDRDGDLQFDAAFVTRAREAADRVVAPLPPAAYAIAANVEIPGSEARIIFTRGAPLQGPVLEFAATLEGEALYIRGIRADVGDEQRRWFPIERTVRRSVYPHSISFAAAEIAILGYEPEGRHLRVRVDRPFETAPLTFVAMGPSIIYIYR